MCEAGIRVILGMILFRGYYWVTYETLCLFTKAPTLSLGFWSAQGLLYLDREQLPSHILSQGPLNPAQP